MTFLQVKNYVTHDEKHGEWGWPRWLCHICVETVGIEVEVKWDRQEEDGGKIEGGRCRGAFLKVDPGYWT